MRSSAATTPVVLRRPLLLVVLVLALVGTLAPPALAHTELEPAEAKAGSTETLTFHVAYEGAGTTGLEVKLPDGSAVVQMPEKPGWTTSSDPDENTVMWAGGPVDADESFEVVVRLPDTTGVVLFPAIQHTTDGTVDWISPDEGEGHDSNPAPRMTLVADPNATTTTAPTTTEAPTATTADLPGTTVEASNDGDGDDSSAPWLIGAGIAAIVAIAIGGWLLKRHQDRAEASAAGGGAGSSGPGGSGDL
jgi:hypothetical protein